MLIKKVYTPPVKARRYLTFWSDFKFKVKGEDVRMKNSGFPTETELFWVGIDSQWDKASIETWLELSSQSNTILDIGANTGIYSMLAKVSNLNAEVHSFEPMDRIREVLNHNSEINQFGLVISNYALSDSKGSQKFYDLPIANHYGASLMNPKGEKGRYVVKEVATETLENYIEHNGLSKIDLMKVDVERHEPNVLKGMGKYLQVFKPTIVLEILDAEVGKQIEEIVNGHGYNFYHLTNEGPVAVKSLQKGSLQNYLLCQESIASNLKSLNHV